MLKVFPPLGIRSTDKIKHTPEGGVAVRLINKAGVNSTKGAPVSNSATLLNAVELAQIGEPDAFGVFYEDGIPDGQPVWVVVTGIADVLFIGSVTLGWFARTFVSGDAGAVAGKAMAEAFPTPPFTSDKHFCEIGHVLESRTGAGLAKCILHFN